MWRSVPRETTKEALRHKIAFLNKQIEELVQERDALLRMYIGDFNEVITDADYTVLTLDHSDKR